MLIWKRRFKFLQIFFHVQLLFSPQYIAILNEQIQIYCDPQNAFFSIKFPSDSYWMRKKKEIQYTPDDNHLMYTNENCWKFFVQKFRTWRQTPMVRGKYTQLMRGKSAKIVLKRYHENNSISFYFKNNFGMAFEKILPPMKFRWRIFVTYQKFMIPKWRKRAPNWSLGEKRWIWKIQ